MHTFRSGEKKGLLLSNDPQDGNDNIKLSLILECKKAVSFVNSFGMVIHGPADLLYEFSLHKNIQMHIVVLEMQETSNPIQ